MNLKDKKLLQRMRVPLGFLLGVVFVFFSRPEIKSLIVGGAIALVGVGVRAWASGHIRKNQKLAISGPYAFTRNPLYLGSFLLGVGFSIAGGVWWLALLFAILFLAVYLPVMRLEAGELTNIFGAEYKAYAEKVPLFFPLPRRQLKTAETKFDFDLYMRYREYRAAIGLVLAWIILLAKAVFLR